MTLSEDIKSRIRTEHEEWLHTQYGDLTPERRKELGAVYTPADVTIQMIEMMDVDSFEDKDVLDPCAGSGNLLAACIIAGADPKRVYGNEFEASMVMLCRERLSKMGVPPENIHRGDASDKYCLTHWGKNYKWPRNQSTALF